MPPSTKYEYATMRYRHGGQFPDDWGPPPADPESVERAMWVLDHAIAEETRRRRLNPYQTSAAEARRIVALTAEPPSGPTD